MANGWWVLLVLVGASLGYMANGRPVVAQSEPLPFGIGDEIHVTVENEQSYTCVVGELHGRYFRCDRARATNIGRRTPEHWISVRHVVSLQKDRQ